METRIQRRTALALVAVGLAGLLVGCSAGDRKDVALDFRNFDTDEAVAGETVVARFSAGRESVVSATFDGAAVSLTKENDGEYIFFQVPPGASPGTGTVVFNGRTSQETETITVVGFRTVIAEAEPNDAIDGSNATEVNNKRIASGTLSSFDDKDHFKFSVLEGVNYRLEVSPAVVGEVFLNGTGFTLTAGAVAFKATGNTILVGLTGGTGNYQVRLHYVPL